MRTHNAASALGSSSVRKSVVPDSRSIASGPQTFASIVTYARDNNLDDASVVAEFAAIFREIENMFDFQPNMRPAR